MIEASGDTLFSRVRNVESELGFRRVWVKFEGSNPTGTQKDRVAQAFYADAHAKGYRVVTLATCGNFGAAIAYACSQNGLRPALFVPTDYHTQRVVEMERLGARVIRVPGSYEDAVATSRRAAAENGWYDANPGGDAQWEIARVGYGAIAREIVEKLGRVPDTVSVAVGNGTTLAGIAAGFREVIGERGNALPSHRLPRFVAASTPRGNPIIKSWKAKSRTCIDLKPEEIRETKVNEPLVNWHSFDGQRALDALYESQGFAHTASDAEMRAATNLLRNAEGINVMTASTAALVGLAKARRDAGDALGDCHVVVLTGRHFPKPRAPEATPASLRATRQVA